MKEKYISVTLLIVLFIASFLVTKLPVMSQVSNNRELLKCGQLARDIIKGAPKPIFSYRVTRYNNGGIIANLWVFPFFYLFGCSLLVLISSLFLLHVMGILTFYYFLLKYFNRNIAAISTYYLIFCPTKITAFKLITMESHSIVSLYTVLMFMSVYSLFFIRENRKIYFSKLQNAFNQKKIIMICIIGGCIAGLACFASLISWLSFFVIMMMWFLCDSAFLKKKYIWIFFLSFIIGFSPWIIFNISCNCKGLLVQSCHETRHSLLKFFLIKKYIFESALVICTRLWQLFSFSEYYFRYDIFIPFELPFILVLMSLMYGVITIGKSLYEKMYIKNNSKYFITNMKIGGIACYVLLYLFLIWRHPKLIPEDFYFLPVLPFLCCLIGTCIDAVWHAKIGFLRMRILALGMALVILAHGFINFDRYMYYNNKVYDTKWLQKFIQKKGYLQKSKTTGQKM